jgi:hypothetical protein
VADPPETYHTSEHLYADLDIPEGAPGTLAPEKRTRAGLAAEEQEDIEPHRRTPARRGRSRRRGGRSERPDQPARTDGPGHRGEAATAEPGTSGRRRRRRRLDGDAVVERSADAASGPAEQAPATEQPAEGAAPRRNRRRRRKPSVSARGGNADPSIDPTDA